jgi:exodeoxyribonuclease X
VNQAIIFDTETTGVNEPVIVEAAWLRIDGADSCEIVDEFLQRYNPGKPIDLGAMATHHIIDAELDGCPPSSAFALPDGTQYLIGHNVDFDWKAIGEPAVKRICTLALSRYLFPGLDSHTQSAMVYHFAEDRSIARESLRDAHSALADVRNCHLVLIALLDELDRRGELASGATWEDVWAVSECARIPTVMTFGKHKGARIADIPSDYKAWLLRQPDVDPYLVKALHGVTA